MEVPRYTLFIQPLLRYLAKHGTPVATGEAYEAAARELGLTDDARAAQLTSGGPVYRNRASWGINWLKRAGLAESPTPGTWRLTPSGRELAGAPPVPLAELLRRFSARVEARRSRSGTGGRVRSSIGSSSPAPTTLGNRKNYRLPARPLEVGGQAHIYEAIRKADGTKLILKRTRSGFEPRMRREIEVQSSLRHVHIMPILDWDTVNYSWYVMPKGKRTMSALVRPIDTVTLLRIVDSIVDALDAAHSVGHPHRDVKPQNVIELEDELGETRWVLADWGLTRRAPGTTTVKRTVTGQFLGSEGFAPPEAYRDAHNVGVPGDIYALGQLIAWAAGVDPVPNTSPTVPTLWQQVVNFMTQQRASDRPQSVGEVRQLLSAIRDSDPDKNS